MILLIYLIRFSIPIIDIDWFNWKYMDNIYGDSYIVLAYDEDKAIGIEHFGEMI